MWICFIFSNTIIKIYVHCINLSQKLFHILVKVIIKSKNKILKLILLHPFCKILLYVLSLLNFLVQNRSFWVNNLNYFINTVLILFASNMLTYFFTVMNDWHDPPKSFVIIFKRELLISNDSVRHFAKNWLWYVMMSSKFLIFVKFTSKFLQFFSITS